MAIGTLAVLACILYSGKRALTLRVLLFNCDTLLTLTNVLCVHTVRLGAGQTCNSLANWPLVLPYDQTLSSPTPLGFSSFTSYNPETYPSTPCVSVAASNDKYILVSVS